MPRTPPGTFHLRLHGQRRNVGNFTTETQRTRRGQNIKNEAAALHQSRLTFAAFEAFLLNFQFLRVLCVSVVKFILRSLCLSAESRVVFDD
jgi:hypothetical protein